MVGRSGRGSCHPGKGQEQGQKRVCHMTGETSHQGETPHVAAGEINERKKALDDFQRKKIFSIWRLKKSFY